VARLPLVAELRDGPGLAVRDEDRIEAEAACAARPFDDPAFEDARPAQLVTFRREGDELADVARPSRFALDPLELGE
jgi:hypothetical protein